jgi:hypothetical protein
MQVEFHDGPVAAKIGDRLDLPKPSVQAYRNHCLSSMWNPFGSQISALE